jgi:hypothetical protein
MNAATADPKANVADGEESRKFLGQSVGFENELIGQSNFPHQPSPRRPIAVANFSNRQVLLDALEFVVDRPPPGRNMPSTALLTQGGKLGISGREHRLFSAISRIAHAVGKARSADLARRFRNFVQAILKAAVNAVPTQSRGLIKIFRLRSILGRLQ